MITRGEIGEKEKELINKVKQNIEKKDKEIEWMAEILNDHEKEKR